MRRSNLEASQPLPVPDCAERSLAGRTPAPAARLAIGTVGPSLPPPAPASAGRDRAAWTPRSDLVMLVLALVVHAGLAVAIAKRTGDRRALTRPRPRPVEVEFRPPPAPVAPAVPERVAPARAEPPRRPARKVAARPRPQPPAAPPPAADKPPPAAPAPARPVFGVSMDSTTQGPSAVAVPVGGVGTADPSRRGAPAGGAAPGEPTGTGYAPVSELEVKTMPDIDADACGRTVTYPDDAEKNGIEGDVRLRVELDERGHVRAVRVLSGLGHGLDQVAAEALKHRCHFTPALDRSGKPVPFIVQSYTFHFELPR
jgi:periplasmic protein TonB